MVILEMNFMQNQNPKERKKLQIIFKKKEIIVSLVFSNASSSLKDLLY
jgi:hypothetical protein